MLWVYFHVSNWRYFSITRKKLIHVFEPYIGWPNGRIPYNFMYQLSTQFKFEEKSKANRGKMETIQIYFISLARLLLKWISRCCTVSFSDHFSVIFSPSANCIWSLIESESTVTCFIPFNLEKKWKLETRL